MRIYPAVHYTMGGLWVDYDLESNVPGLEIMSGLSLKYRLLKLILKLIGFKKYFNANERDMIAKARKSMDKKKFLCFPIVK